MRAAKLIILDDILSRVNTLSPVIACIGTDITRSRSTVRRAAQQIGASWTELQPVTSSEVPVIVSITLVNA